MTTTRRELLVAALLTAAGCATGHHALLVAAEPAADPDAPLALAGLKQVQALLRSYRSFVAVQPVHTKLLSPVVAHHRRHERDLRELLRRLGTAVPDAVPTGRPSGPRVGRGAPELEDLSGESHRAARKVLARVGDAQHPEVARMLAGVAASMSQHAVLLHQLSPSGRP